MASGDMGEGAMTALQKGSTLADNKNSSTAALITNRSGGFSKTARVFLSQFVQGAKLLWAEIGLARETSARRKAGHVLSFQEDRLLRQVLYYRISAGRIATVLAQSILRRRTSTSTTAVTVMKTISCRHPF